MDGIEANGELHGPNKYWRDTKCKQMGDGMSVLTKEVIEKIDAWTCKYPPEQRRSAVLPALMIAQDANKGWLTSALIEAVADYLVIPHIAAYEVTSFYSMYECEPIGQHKISVCTNISCQLAGSAKIVEHLEKRCGIKMGETSRDGRYTLRSVECMGACTAAPMLEVHKQYHENLTNAKVDEILATLEDAHS
jgi:NADH-quinone oxidoreductase subunit E